MTKMTTIPVNYNNIRAEIVELLNAARSAASRSVNAVMTATYWEIGRRIVQSEQAGEKRAEYVRAQTIRLFVPFGQKQGRGVHLKDQKLADVLAEFSRAKQRPVSTIFWNANLNVMQEACHLAQQVLEMLVLVHEARQP